MENAIQRFEELNRQEHDFAIAFFTEPEKEKFRAVRKGFRTCIESGWFPAGYRQRPSSIEGDSALPNNFTQRVLLAVESYEDEGLGTVYVGYFGDMTTTLDAHLSLYYRRYATRLDVEVNARGFTKCRPAPTGKLLVFGEEFTCVDCRSSGETRSAVTGGPGGLVCPECSGTGWIFYKGKIEQPILTNQTAARALVKMTCQLDQKAWNQMFPDGDGLG